MYTSTIKDQRLQDFVIPQPPSDTISSLLYSPTDDILTACSWDGSVYIYMPSTPGSSENMSLKTSIPNNNSSPILCSCFSSDGAFLFTGSADGKIRAVNMRDGSVTDVGLHDLAISCMAYSTNGMLITGSWDKKLKFWNLSASQVPVKEYTLEGKIYAMDSKANILVVCLSGNIIAIFDVYRMEKIVPSDSYSRPGYCTISKYKSNTHTMGGYSSGSFGNKYPMKLQWQIRTVACTDNGEVAVLGSIDARCDLASIQSQEVDQSGLYTFRCHKTDKVLHPVNKVLFHPAFQDSILTCGGDGLFNIWKRRDRMKIGTGGPGNENSITAAAFDKTGRYLAFAIGYDWSKGYISQIPVPVEIRVALIPEQIHHKK